MRSNREGQAAIDLISPRGPRLEFIAGIAGGDECIDEYPRMCRVGLVQEAIQQPEAHG